MLEENTVSAANFRGYGFSRIFRGWQLFFSGFRGYSSRSFGSWMIFIDFAGINLHGLHEPPLNHHRFRDFARILAGLNVRDGCFWMISRVSVFANFAYG